MKKTLFFSIVLVSFFGFNFIASAQEDSLNNDGSSMQKAVIIQGVSTVEDMELQEQDYLESRFGTMNEKWTLYEEEPFEENSRHYDKITIKFLDSEEVKTVYFDITQPFQEFNMTES